MTASGGSVSGGSATNQVGCGGLVTPGGGVVEESGFEERGGRWTISREPRWLVWPGLAKKVCSEREEADHARRRGEYECHPVSIAQRVILLVDRADSS